MTRDPWDAVIVPQCPDSCPWRLTCSNDTQAGIASLFREGRLTRPEECVFFERRAQVHKDTTGREPPASAAELLEQLAERRAIVQEGA